MPGRDTPIFKPPSAEDPAIEDTVRRLIAAYRPECIYLFGSVARGDADPDSDYDLICSWSFPTMRLPNGAGAGWHTRRCTARAAAEVLVCTRSYFEARRSLKASLPGTVLREGRLLHVARGGTPRRCARLACEGEPGLKRFLRDTMFPSGKRTTSKNSGTTASRATLAAVWMTPFSG